MSTDETATPAPAPAAPAGGVDAAVLREQLRQFREIEALLAPAARKAPDRPAEADDESLLGQVAQAMKYAAAISPMVLGVLPIVRRYLGAAGEGEAQRPSLRQPDGAPGKIDLTPHACGVRLVGTDPDGVRVLSPAVVFDGPTEMHRVYSLRLPGLDPQSLRLIERPGCAVQILARGTDDVGPLRYRAEVRHHGPGHGGSTKVVLDATTATLSFVTPHAFEDTVPVEIDRGTAPLPGPAPATAEEHARAAAAAAEANQRQVFAVIAKFQRGAPGGAPGGAPAAAEPAAEPVAAGAQAGAEPAAPPAAAPAVTLADLARRFGATLPQMEEMRAAFAELR